MSTFSLLFIAVLGIALLLFLVIVTRIHAFIALLLTSLFVAVIGGIPPAEIADVIQAGMGNTLGYIAIIIGLGAMFGELLQASGGAEIISDTLIKKSGVERAPWALGFTGLIIAIPVFFDVALILLIPLVYSMARRTKRSLLYYGIPLVAGIAVAHSFIPPTPGPVAVAGLLGADLGWVILFGLIAGIPAMIVGGIYFGKYIAGQIHIDPPDEDEASSEASSEATQQNAAAAIAETEPRQPQQRLSFGLVAAILAVPLGLILLNTVSEVVLPEDSLALNWIAFIGHPFVALILAVLLAMYFLGTQQGFSRREVLQFATRSLEPVGLIILVTGAGGVFGKVLVETGVGEALANVMAASNLPIILLAFLIATVVRVSQGSATVSMVTAAGLMAPAVELGDYSAPMVAAITIAIAVERLCFLTSMTLASGWWGDFLA